MFPMTGALRLVGFALAALAQNSGDKGLLVGPTASLPKPDEEIPEDFRTTVTASIHQFENGKESSLLADVQAKRIDHGSFFCGEIQDDFPTTDLTFGAYAISAIVLILGKWSPVTGGRTPWFVALTALASRFLLASIALSRQASSQNCESFVAVGEQDLVIYQTVNSNLTLEPDKNRTEFLARWQGSSIVEWYRDGKLDLDRNNEIVIQSVQPSDNGTQLKYDVLYSEDGINYPVSFSSQTALLIVGSFPSLLLDSDESFFYNSTSNSTRLLPLNVAGIPQTNLTVDREDLSPASSDKFIIKGDKINVKELRLNDRGKYLIKAQNCFGNNSVEIDIKIGVQPVMQNITDTQQLLACGDNVTLGCSSLGYPEALVIWNSRIPSKEKSERYLDGYRYYQTSTLILTNAQRTIDGINKFECQATNRAGRGKLTFSLTVHCKPSKCSVSVVAATNTPIRATIVSPKDSGGLKIEDFIILAFGGNGSDIPVYNETRRAGQG
eukprot:m.189103 g.189103  ORF g.189103 m.189103 type:complete len:496 (+) comp39403_c2_seq7:261-1748(+)